MPACGCSATGCSIPALIGLIIIAVNVIGAIGAPLIAPFDQADVVGDAWADPDPTHWLGLDNLGRDLFSRLIYGARMSIGLSFAHHLPVVRHRHRHRLHRGGAEGLGRHVLSRLVDLLLSMPTLIFAFIILSVLGTELPVLIATLAILDSVKVFRLARALAMNIGALEYVEVARVRGEGLWWVIRKEILPNAMAPLIAEFGLRFCFAFLFIAALTFLGLGVQPPSADWGSMVRDYRDMINLDQPAPLYPGRRDRAADHRGELRGGLDAVHPLARARRGRMSGHRSGRTVGEDILHVENLRVEVRTDAGPGPVLVDDVSFDSAARRGAGADRRERRRQVHHRADARWATRAAAAPSPAASSCSRAATSAPMTAAERRALRGPGVAYIAQCAAASFNPAMTLMDAGLRNPGHARPDDHGRGEKVAASAVPRTGTAEPRHRSATAIRIRSRGGQLQRAMAAMAMAARPDILVFDEPTTALDVTTQVEVLAVVPQADPRARHGGDLHHPRPRRGGADRRPHHGAAPRQDGRARHLSNQILQAPREEYTRRLVAERVAGHNFRARPDDRRSAAAGGRATWSPAIPGWPRVIDDVSVDVSIAATRWRWWARAAAASARSRG